MKKQGIRNEKVQNLVIGSGLAGLTVAIHLADRGSSVTVVTCREIMDAATNFAQGGVACVTDDNDSFQEHVIDTLNAGAYLCDENIVRQIVESGPAALREMVRLGAKFTTKGEVGDTENVTDFHLGREGGHTKRRILHAGDITGAELMRTLVASAQNHPNIQILTYHSAIDLITTKRMGLDGDNRVLGAHVLDIKNNEVITFRANSVTVAAGGVGKVYLYTSNPDISCGAGVALCYRAGLPIRNMEFYQFHPTILHHESIRSFLISEAVRGEGAILKRYDDHGTLIPFMQNYHPMKDLAPRDVVARAIDNEMKKTGQQCVWLDITHQPKSFLLKRFPNIYKKCLEAGFDMATQPIPVVPAAHYCCGGVQTDINGWTSIYGLYAVGECASTGLHGANRLASNSLLEAMVIGHNVAESILKEDPQKLQLFDDIAVPPWHLGSATNSDERVVIAHNWAEIRQFMWDYVGIVRTDKRLERAKSRIVNIRKEIEKYYWDFIVTYDLIELRNIAQTAEIIIDSAMQRKESRGLHFNADYPDRNPKMDGVDTIVQLLF